MQRTKTLLLTLTLFASFYSYAQTIQEISTGSGYRKQSFIKLAAGTETLIDDTAWDIAFTVYGVQDAGIHINESSGSSMGQPLAGVELFDAKSTDFSAIPDPSTLSANRLYNNELSWNYGAFNEGRNPASPFDYGWGAYSPATNSVVGSKVFVIKLRNGAYKKIQFQSLNGTTYTFRYADLNGNNEVTKTVNKADHTGKTLAYYSLATNQTVTSEPAGGFDLLFCRYITVIYDPGSMADINYNVTGILSGRGVETAKATGVDPLSVKYSDWDDSLTTRLDVVGHDWKTFTGSGWSVPNDVAYFVRTANDQVFKLVFIDFEGSATGKAVLEKTDLGVITNITTPDAPVSTFDAYPNPANQELNVLYTVKQGTDTDFDLRMVDLNGRVLRNWQMNTGSGLQNTRIDVSDIPSGVYFLHISGAKGMATQKVVISH